MAHDVFISYPTKNKAIADDVCQALEQTGLRCWIAHRDLRLGANYSGDIVKAIKGCQILVLIFSEHANESRYVLTEVRTAFSCRKHIISLRVRQVPVSDDLELYLSTPHWLDAFKGPVHRHFPKLRDAVTALILPSGQLPARHSTIRRILPELRRSLPKIALGFCGMLVVGFLCHTLKNFDPRGMKIVTVSPSGSKPPHADSKDLKLVGIASENQKDDTPDSQETTHGVFIQIDYVAPYQRTSAEAILTAESTRTLYFRKNGTLTGSARVERWTPSGAYCQLSRWDQMPKPGDELVIVKKGDLTVTVEVK